jgi:Uma2 family endonuclease
MATGLSVTETLLPPGLDPDASKFYEVVDGEFKENPPMGAEESLLASLLQELLGPFARAKGLGRVATETLFLIDRSGKLKRCPDLAFISVERRPLRRRVPQAEAWDVVPDLAVEVVSDTHSVNSVVIRIEEYFQAGVREVWVIYPVVGKVYVYDAPARVRILQLGDELDGEEILPGFRVALATLFEQGDEEPGATADGPQETPRGD